MPPITIDNLRGGRNGADSPIELPNNQCVEGRNVDWLKGPLGAKRGGSDELDISTSGLGEVWDLYRHVPDGEELNAQFWAVDSTGVVKRYISGAWETINLDDAITANFQEVAFCTFNGKLFMGYKSAKNRLHVYDPVLNKVRVVGLAAPSGAPTITNTGAGTYAAIARYYRTRALQLNGTIIVRRSEPSAASTIFTPSGTGTAARVTKVGMPGEGETHWEVEVSLDGDIWFLLAGQDTDAVSPPIAIGTTTYDDSTVTTAYLDLPTAEEVGSFTVPLSARYLTTDGNHLLMAGNFDSASNPICRIYNTPALGSSDHGDDERIIITDAIKGYTDINEKDGGRITGLSETTDGSIYAFKYRQTWRGTPTGDDDAVYIFKKISDKVGCIFFKTIISAEDVDGNPITAFLSYKGPYRVGKMGIDYMGRDIEDVWNGNTPGEFTGNSMFIDAPTMVGHGVYYADKHQLWWWIPLGASSSPNFKIVQDVKQATRRDAFGIRGGWATHDGISSRAICSVMFSKDFGASLSRKLKPYIGYREP